MDASRFLVAGTLQKAGSRCASAGERRPPHARHRASRADSDAGFAAKPMTVQNDPLVGRKLGRYQIEALLGYGKGATVYRAIDPVFGRAVAIKVLDPLAARDPVVVAAFLRDAETLSRLSHPHILPIYEAA